MTEIGYALSSEEHPPNDLVRFAAGAEERGFPFALISDHFHPWVDRQGHSPFVWSVLGGIAQRTERLRIGTGVTAPIIRMHPAIVAHAAATVAAMMPGRFFLGVGTGENLNEHVVGLKWPPAAVRRDMLGEAIDVMRALWSGDLTNHRGTYYTVENARIYTLPDEPPPIYVAAAGDEAAELAGRAGDGMIATSPKAETLEAFRSSGGAGKPTYGMVHVCYHRDEDTAKRIAHEIWPNSAIEGELGQELPLPRHFEQAAQMVTPDDVAETCTCGPDPEKHIAAVRSYVDAGYDHVYVHQVGPDQDAFLDFYAEHVVPVFAGAAERKAS